MKDIKTLLQKNATFRCTFTVGKQFIDFIRVCNYEK